MNCCQCEGIEREFDEAEAKAMLKDYQREGLRATSQALVDALLSAGVAGATLLDIGGGIGGLQHALLEAGAVSATHVDASLAYLETAKKEAARRHLHERIRFLHGDFVTLAPEITPADIVTLDRVICCYHDMAGLVGRSIERAQRLYGLVYPRDDWWTRLGARTGNLFLRLSRNPFRIFAHPTAAVDALIRSHGFRQRFHHHTWLWQVVLYERSYGYPT